MRRGDDFIPKSLIAKAKEMNYNYTDILEMYGNVVEDQFFLNSSFYEEIIRDSARKMWEIRKKEPYGHSSMFSGYSLFVNPEDLKHFPNENLNYSLMYSLISAEVLMTI